MDLCLAGYEEEFNQLISKHNMLNIFRFNENLTGNVMEKTHIIMDHPLYIDQCALDDSANEIYRVYYNHIKTVERCNCGESVRGWEGDTD